MLPLDRIKCDIVLPVYNGLTYVKECLDSLLRFTPSDIYHLNIIDDYSDAVTEKYLRDQATIHPRITVERNSENLGYVKSCNLEISLGSSPYVLLLNSDVVLTPGWLERMLECAESDPRIASVNPLTNYASQINLPMAAGANFFGMDKILKKKTLYSFPDVVTGVGFCMLLRRSALKDVGLFDEVFGKGYCEDSDLCMRLTARGYRTVVAENVYIYHKGRSAFKDRDERYRHNRRIFDARWQKEYCRQFRAFQKADPLSTVRGLFSLRQRWEPVPAIWVTAREMIAGLRGRDPVTVGRAAAGGLFRVLRARRGLATPESVAKVTRPKRLRVTYVLHKLVAAGGVLSVIQLVNELILLGVEARIVALFEDPAIYDWTKLYTKPVIFHNQKELVENFPETDIAVATLWNTAPWVAELVRKGRAHEAVYFIQDYEPWFFREDQKELRQKVKGTYRMIESRIVKSEWLREKIREDGFSANNIALGMDLGRFYPRDVSKSGQSILAMARPGTPRRGFKSTIEALDRVKKMMPEVEIVLFGDRFLSSHDIPFPYRNEGVITDQDRLANLYSEADLFLDGSDFQGFGRCGLEAMACGTACVLTGVGGITEYARDGENSLIVSPGQPEDFARAVTAILKDPQLQERLRKAGLATAKAYCHKREAGETLAYFNEIMEK
ncbi:MAG: glycosyltransferase [Thermodesulfobacteriota bacterium]|nr:glycosyltransferase [Thermodesulfobacteriota bacterium]